LRVAPPAGAGSLLSSPASTGLRPRQGECRPCRGWAFVVLPGIHGLTPEARRVPPLPGLGVCCPPRHPRAYARGKESAAPAGAGSLLSSPASTGLRPRQGECRPCRAWEFVVLPGIHGLTPEARRVPPLAGLGACCPPRHPRAYARGKESAAPAGPGSLLSSPASTGLRPRQ